MIGMVVRQVAALFASGWLFGTVLIFADGTVHRAAAVRGEADRASVWLGSRAAVRSRRTGFATPGPARGAAEPIERVTPMMDR